MRGLLAAERIKSRRTWIVPLAFLGPLGFVLMGVIDFAVRDEYLHKVARQVGPWQALGSQLMILELLALALGVALLASMLFDIDHRSRTWKELFALPVSRAGVYVGKVTLIAALIGLASALSAVGYAGVWVWQGYGALPWGDLAKVAGAAWIAALPLIAVQSALSAHLRNQAVPIAAGVFGGVIAVMTTGLPDWAPWTLGKGLMGTVFGAPGDAARFVALALAWTVGLVVVSAAVFARREVA